jgi:hypothetical protein
VAAAVARSRSFRLRDLFTQMAGSLAAGVRKKTVGSSPEGNPCNYYDVQYMLPMLTMQVAGAALPRVCSSGDFRLPAAHFYQWFMAGRNPRGALAVPVTVETGSSRFVVNVLP